MKIKLTLPGGAELRIERQRKPQNPELAEDVWFMVLLGLPPVIMVIFALVLVHFASA